MSWLEERTGLKSFSKSLGEKSPGATLGMVATFFILLQIATGTLLLFYYTPSWKEAHSSVVRITTEISWGWLVRSLHVWSAHLLVATIFMHLVGVFWRKAYEKPKEMTWLTGVALLLLMMGAAFTGQVLPLDEEGLSGVEIAASFADNVKLGTLVRGGSDVGPATLGRMFTAHVILIPATVLALLLAHAALFAKHRKESTKRMPALLAALASLAVVTTLAFVLPAGIGLRGDPMNTGPGVKPMWMFLPLYQGLKLVPAWAGLLLPLVPIGFLVAVPFIKSRKAILAIGGIIFVAAIALGVMGARA